MEYFYEMATPVGDILLVEQGETLAQAALGAQPPAGATKKQTALLTEAARQLEEYFAGRRRHFALPLAERGTAFQQKVWQALCGIPYGETRSYGQVAAAVGTPKAARAVGMANNRNPWLIIVPCHRVIGANGAMVGYGAGLPVKEWLLAHEHTHRL